MGPLRRAFAGLAGSLGPVTAQPNLRRTALATFLGWAAEWGFVVALLVHAYQLDGVLAVGIMGLVRTAPAAAIAPLLTSALDRVPSHLVLAFVHAGRGAVVAAVALAALAGAPIVILYVLAAVEGVVAVVHRPAVMALIPGLCRDPAELVAGNASLSIVEGIATLIGPAIGGVLIIAVGPPLALAVPAVALFGAFVLIARVRPASVRRPASIGAVSLLVDGLRTVGAVRHLRLLFGLVALQTFVRGALIVLLLDASVQLLGFGEAGVGYLTSAIGAGGLIGAVVVAAAAHSGRQLGGPIRVGLALWGVPIIVLGLLPTGWIALPMMAIIGIGNAVFDVALFTLLQRTVPNVVRGRVLGLVEAMIMLSVGLGSVAAPQLLAVGDIRPSLIVVGLLLPLAAAASGRGLALADAAIVIPPVQLALLRGIPAFRPLPLTVLEQLAEDLEAVEFAAGEQIVKQHEEGDAFYIIGSGRASVAVDGSIVSELGPGESFGEIALMRDVPRTATVTTIHAVQGFALRREAFLAALGSERLSRQAAEQVVAAYMPPVPDRLP